MDALRAVIDRALGTEHSAPNIDGLVKSPAHRHSGESRSLQVIEINGSRLSPG
jgi:hypothetical protein